MKLIHEKWLWLAVGALMLHASFSEHLQDTMYEVISDDDKKGEHLNNDGMAIAAPTRRVSIEFQAIGGDENVPSVLLSVNGRAPQEYHVGDRITPNVVLEKLGIDQMMVRYINPVETISFEREPKLSADKKSIGDIEAVQEIVPQDLANHSSVRRVDIRFPEGVFSEGITRIQDGQYIIDREMVQKQLSKGYVYRHAQFKKADDDGYVITEIARGSLYEKGGLEDGDVIKKINDRELNSPLDLMYAYKHLYEQSYLMIDVGRDDQQVSFYYFLK